jgi:hypothetical protein
MIILDTTDAIPHTINFLAVRTIPGSSAPGFVHCCLLAGYAKRTARCSSMPREPSSRSAASTPSWAAQGDRGQRLRQCLVKARRLYRDEFARVQLIDEDAVVAARRGRARARARSLDEEEHDVRHIGEGFAVGPAVVDALAPFHEDGEPPGVLLENGIAALAQDRPEAAVPGALEAEEVELALGGPGSRSRLCRRPRGPSGLSRTCRPWRRETSGGCSRRPPDPPRG